MGRESLKRRQTFSSDFKSFRHGFAFTSRLRGLHMQRQKTGLICSVRSVIGANFAFLGFFGDGNSPGVLDERYLRSWRPLPSMHCCFRSPLCSFRFMSGHTLTCYVQLEFLPAVRTYLLSPQEMRTNGRSIRESSPLSNCRSSCTEKVTSTPRHEFLLLLKPHTCRASLPVRRPVCFARVLAEKNGFDSARALS